MGGLCLCLKCGLHAYVCGCCAVYVVFIKGRGYAKGIMLVNSNVPNMYVKDVVAVFKLFAGAHPPVKKFFAPPPRRCTGAAQPYTRLCVCSDSLLTRSKWNINSSCQVPGLHRVEVQRPIS